MEEPSKYLFVYGTLLDKQNEFALYLKESGFFLGGGKFKGKLYDIGPYPGAIHEPFNNTYVFGHVILIKDPENTFRKLDEYEGFGDNEPCPNEFIRQLVEVETDEMPVMCWAYLYNLPVDGFTQIISGSYLR